MEEDSSCWGQKWLHQLALWSCSFTLIASTSICGPTSVKTDLKAPWCLAWDTLLPVLHCANTATTKPEATVATNTFWSFFLQGGQIHNITCNVHYNHMHVFLSLLFRLQLRGLMWFVQAENKETERKAAEGETGYSDWALTLTLKSTKLIKSARRRCPQKGGN